MSTKKKVVKKKVASQEYLVGQYVADNGAASVTLSEPLSNEALLKAIERNDEWIISDVSDGGEIEVYKLVGKYRVEASNKLVKVV